MIWMWELHSPHALFDHETSALPTVCHSSAFVLSVRSDEDAADVPATPTGSSMTPSIFPWGYLKIMGIFSCKQCTDHCTTFGGYGSGSFCLFHWLTTVCDDQSDDASWPVQWASFWANPPQPVPKDQVLCGWVWVICNASVRLLTRTAGAKYQSIPTRQKKQQTQV